MTLQLSYDLENANNRGKLKKSSVKHCFLLHPHMFLYTIITHLRGG